ncbi:MAG: hydrogenase iron-sulfur subunit [Nitrospirota bacterium]
MNNFEPRLLGFLCNWCSYEGADLAGRSGREYPSNFLAIRVMCSGRIDPQLVIGAFKMGADGVLVLGCHQGECHYKEGNYQALKKLTLLRNMLGEFGIEKERLRFHWVSASEGDKFVEVVSQMVSDLKKLGPLL